MTTVVHDDYIDTLQDNGDGTFFVILSLEGKTYRGTVEPTGDDQ